MVHLSAVVPYDGPRQQEENARGSQEAPAAAWGPLDDRVAVVPQDPLEPQDAAAVTPVTPWRSNSGGSVEKVPRPPYWRWECGFLVLLALADNALCYVTYASVQAFHERLYNVVDVQLALIPGLDVALIICAAIGSACFLMLLILVECNGLPLFHEIMNFRLYFSALPCGCICAILLFFTEQTQWAPFTTLMAVFLFMITWCIHMRTRCAHRLSLGIKIALDVNWFLALSIGAFLLILFATDSFEFITQSDDMNCPYADNGGMPLKVLVLGQWYCAPWDSEQSTEIWRTPLNEEALPLDCAASFTSTFGVSIEPHKVSCPVGCLRTYQGNDVVGCGIYAADSPICLSALHAGVLTDEGGETVVYGRIGVPMFEGCSRHSIISGQRLVTQSPNASAVEQPSSVQPIGRVADDTGSADDTNDTDPGDGGRRLLTTPLVRDAKGLQIPQAYHFNNMDNTREYVWLKRFQLAAQGAEGVEAGKPWTRVRAVISARFAGIELEDEELQLGERPPQELFSEGPGQCNVHERGVLCQGRASAVVRLDFCLPEEKECPA